MFPSSRIFTLGLCPTESGGLRGFVRYPMRPVMLPGRADFVLPWYRSFQDLLQVAGRRGHPYRLHPSFRDISSTSQVTIAWIPWNFTSDKRTRGRGLGSRRCTCVATLSDLTTVVCCPVAACQYLRSTWRDFKTGLGLGFPLQLVVRTDTFIRRYICCAII